MVPLRRTISAAAVSGRGWDFKRSLPSITISFPSLNFKANDLSTAVVGRYKDERLEQGAANSTINRELAMLRGAYNLGMRAMLPKVTRIPFFESLKVDNARKGFF